MSSGFARMLIADPDSIAYFEPEVLAQTEAEARPEAVFEPELDSGEELAVFAAVVQRDHERDHLGARHRRYRAQHAAPPRSAAAAPQARRTAVGTGSAARVRAFPRARLRLVPERL